MKKFFKQKKVLYLLSLIGVIFTTSLLTSSCVNDDLIIENSTKNPDKNPTILGKKKEIPFTIENMQKAYENLLNNKTAKDFPKKGLLKDGFSGGNYTITTTHKYVKFLPQDSLQYEIISNDSILAVSDIPFEYEVNNNGDFYVDPSLPPGSELTYYYSVVPVNYSLPNNVPHEIIANLHFTPEDDIQDIPTDVQKEELNFFHDLNLEARKITDDLSLAEEQELFYNIVLPDGTYQQVTWQEAINMGQNIDNLIIDFGDNEPMNNLKGLFGSRWTPTGKVQLYDEVIRQNLGVWDAKINVRKWGFLIISSTNTNNYGDFTASRIRTKYVKYAIVFKNNSKRFVVKDNTVFWDARDRDTRRYNRQGWYPTYYKGTKAHFFASIHNAARDYYQRACLQNGIRNPNGINTLRICGKWKSGTSNMFDVPIPIIGGLISEIRIYAKNTINQINYSDDIYATTVHEMAHASHYRMDPLFFINVFNPCERKLIRESWATGVEWYITNNRYNQLTGNNYTSTTASIYFNTELRWWKGRKQLETIDGLNYEKIENYSPIFIDLMDATNQSQLNAVGSQPIDRTSGYILYELQESVNNSRGVYGLRERIKNMHSNNSSIYVDELFSQYMFSLCTD